MAVLLKLLRLLIETPVLEGFRVVGPEGLEPPTKRL